LEILSKGKTLFIEERKYFLYKKMFDLEILSKGKTLNIEERKNV
jgi:hypothetical protein